MEDAAMARVDVEIPAPAGLAGGSLHVPDGDGPWPGVLVFPDAGGLRETFREMGDRIAGLGYVALIPDIYYREGDWAPFDMATAFSDEKERARLFGVMGRLTNERIIADSDAYADFLLARPEVSGSAIGTTGYCLGGRMSMLAAGGIGHKIGGGADRRHRLRGRRDRGRLVHDRAGRAARVRADRGRGGPHGRVLPGPSRVRRRRPRHLRRAGGRTPLGRAPRPLRRPPVIVRLSRKT